MITQSVDGLPCRLKATHDLGWLSSIGRVFCVFDQLISGNLCFGVESSGMRLFVKYAGAPTINYAAHPQTAIKRLMDAAPLYDTLAHEALTKKLDQARLPDGFCIIFSWFEGYALAPLPHHLERLHTLSVLDRLRMIDPLLDFLRQVAAKDYLAAGLADQHILVGFERMQAAFCSVDHFLPLPASTPYPKMPGAPWFVPPEGYQVGHPLDETAQVYAMGALTQLFFGDRQNPTKWMAPKSLQAITRQALSEQAGLRQANTASFLRQWREAVMRQRF